MQRIVKIDKTEDAIYYNLTLNKGFTATDDTGFNTPGSFSEYNDKPFLRDSGDWWISLMRCSIPTSFIPRYIFPIQLGALQNNINYSYNFVTFRYATAPGVYLDPFASRQTPWQYFQSNVTFQTELFNVQPVGKYPQISYPLPPSENNGQQDISGLYYYIYNIMSLVKMFNDTLATLWSVYITQMQSQFSVTLPAGIQPFYTYDDVSMLWSFNADSILFGQDHYPRVEVYIDNLAVYNTFCPASYNCKPSFINDIQLLRVVNLQNNSFTSSARTFYKMSAEQSANVSYSGFQKIIIEVTGDIIVKHPETDAVPLYFQESTTSYTQKPLVSMLVDLEVDRDQWAVNSQYIQFQASSKEQVRLISLANNEALKNFNLNIFWLNNYGLRVPVEIPSIGISLSIKLAFFKKY